MFSLLPYFWMLFMVGLVIATIVAALMARPKRKPKAVVDSGAESAPAEQEPSLDFADELAQMDQK